MPRDFSLWEGSALHAFLLVLALLCLWSFDRGGLLLWGMIHPLPPFGPWLGVILVALMLYALLCELVAWKRGQRLY